LVVDQDLAVVLLNLRRRLIDEYGTGPAAMMLIDRAVSANRDFIRVTGARGERIFAPARHLCHGAQSVNMCSAMIPTSRRLGILLTKQ